MPVRNSLLTAQSNFIEDHLLVREALYPRSVLLHRSSLNEELLHEGIDKETIKSVVQYLASAAAEYGLGAVTLPAYGAGLAVGPATETAVDSLFAAESVASTVDAVASLGSKFGEFTELFSGAYDTFSDMSGNLSGFYDKLKTIVKKALKLLGKKIGDKVDGLAKKLRGILESVLSSITSAIKSGIKLLIPDATIGLAVAEGLAKIVTELAERPFTLAQKAIDKVGFLKEWVGDPSKAVAFFKDIFKQLIELMKKAGEKLKDMSWGKAILILGPVGAPLWKKFGHKGIEKAASMFEKYLPTLMSVLDKVLSVVIPVFLTALALFQILVSGEYKEKDSDKAGGDKAAAANDEPAKLAAGVVRISKNDLQKLIHESLLEHS
ncbi:MAG TPA: hypothetical protein EYF95_04090 [Flavobacteriales bacterium]|jgi:phage-related protein|nr:hypothetical protein [Flavobacteriales bacterium]